MLKKLLIIFIPTAGTGRLCGTTGGTRAGYPAADGLHPKHSIRALLCRRRKGLL